jgi:hypothetical protein
MLLQVGLMMMMVMGRVLELTWRLLEMRSDCGNHGVQEIVQGRCRPMQQFVMKRQVRIARMNWLTHISHQMISVPIGDSTWWFSSVTIVAGIGWPICEVMRWRGAMITESTFIAETATQAISLPFPFALSVPVLTLSTAFAVSEIAITMAVAFVDEARWWWWRRAWRVMKVPRRRAT